MCRWCVFLLGGSCLFLMLGPSIRGEPSIPEDNKPNAGAAQAWVDNQGEPLSPRALARMGSHRFWPGAVRVVAFSPDGKVVGSSGGERLRLWQTATGKELDSLEGGSTAFFAFAPGGKTLAWSTGDSAIHHGNRTTAKEAVPFTGHRDPSREMLDIVAGWRCKAAWLSFLKKHGKELQGGKRFRLADQALPLAELFPRLTFDQTR